LRGVRNQTGDRFRLARQALAALPLAAPFLYARVDLIRGHAGQAQLLELELIEPSLFLAQAPQAAARFAACICRFASAATVPL
jgi:hypothetical protein